MTRLPRPNLRKTLPDPMVPGEVARLFGVETKTLTRWEDVLHPFRTLGGHRRYHRDIVVDEYERRLTERRRS